MTFQQMVSGIESAYATMGHTLGWRFLRVSKQVLEQHPKIALITANPGGSTFEGSAASCENGCAYLVERWGASAPGKSSLQQQVQQLFASFAQFVGEGQTGSQLIEASLIGYFVPFRLPRCLASRLRWPLHSNSGQACWTGAIPS